MRTVPLTLITGFLGSGKSTLINRLLQAFPETVFGVVTNEYGDVGIESEIIGAPEDQIVELATGCMCCVRRDDLVGGVARLLESRPEITQVLVEASGGSDPEPVAQTFIGHNPAGRTRFHACICVVDAVGFHRDRVNHNVVLRQIRQADTIVVTKLDLVPAQDRPELYRSIQALVPSTPIQALEPRSDLRAVLNPDEPEPTELARPAATGLSAHPEAAGLTSLHTTGARSHRPSLGGDHSTLHSYLHRSRRPVDREQLEQLFARMSSSVIRAKGLLRPHGPEHAHITYILQYSAGRTQLYPCPKNRFDQEDSLILFVGDDLDTAALAEALRRCEHDPHDALGLD